MIVSRSRGRVRQMAAGATGSALRIWVMTPWADVGVEDGPAGGKLVQRGAEAVDVGAVVDRLPRACAPARGSCSGACP